MISSLGFYDRNDLHGSPIIRNQRMSNCNSWEHFFIITLISINYCNCRSIKCPLVLERNRFGKILWCLYHSQLKYIQYGIQCMSEVCCNKEHILKYHMNLWQSWDHGSSSVANYQILNCGFEHFINYCDFLWLSQISFVWVNQILWNPILNNCCTSSMQHL